MINYLQISEFFQALIMLNKAYCKQNLLVFIPSLILAANQAINA